MSDKTLTEGYQPILFDFAPAQPDTMYTVFLRKRGTTLECNIMNAVTKVPLLSVSKDVTTAGISFIAPFGESKDISVRTRNAPAEVIGYFDNIYVTVIPGDINLSGKIDLVDIILGLQVITSMNPAGISVSGDFNGDGKIGMAEVLHDMKHVSE